MLEGTSEGAVGAGQDSTWDSEANARNESEEDRDAETEEGSGDLSRIADTVRNVDP